MPPHKPCKDLTWNSVGVSVGGIYILSCYTKNELRGKYARMGQVGVTQSVLKKGRASKQIYQDKGKGSVN